MIVPWPNNLNRYLHWLGAVKESVAKLTRPLIVTSLLVTMGTLGLRYLGLIELAELAVYDQLIQLKPNDEEDDRILVVGITETDLQSLQEWPISDRTLSQAITNLEQHQPQTIAIDVFRDFPHEPGTQRLLTQLQQNSKIISICKVSAVNDLGTPPPPGVPPEQVGFADLVVDSGGILRRSLLLTGPPEPTTPFPKQHLCNQPRQALLSLSLSAAMRYLAAQGIEADFKDQTLTFGSTVIPPIQPGMGGYQGVDANGYQIMLHYRSEKHSVPKVSLMEVINGQVDPALIRDRIIFIGYTTPQAKDDFYTPYSIGKDDNQKMPGVIVHAQSTSQLISTVLEGRPLIWGWPAAVEALWILAWALAGGILGWYLRHPVAFALVTVIGCGGLYGLCLLIFTQGGWIPFVPPTFTFIGTAVGVVLLDRFNRSVYGQQVYRKVKNLLHLKIEIDEEKLEQQVSDITGTDYFHDLKNKVKNLRNHPASFYDWNHQQDDASNLSYNLDAVLHSEGSARSGTIPHNGQRLPSQSLNQQDQNPQSNDDNAFDVTQHLIQQTNYIRRETVTDQAPRYVAFVIEQAFCEENDTSAVTQDYLVYLTKKINTLQSNITTDSSRN